MLVSMREMGLCDEHDGIIELPDDAPVGAPFARLLGLDDPVIDINVTPDRADCLGVHGIARDLAAAGIGQAARARSSPPVTGSFDSPIKWQRDLPADQQHACPYVVGRYFRGVKNGAEPEMAAGPADWPSACGRSRRWSTSPTTSPSISAGRCTCSMPRSSPAISPCASRRPGEFILRARRQDLRRSTTA